MLVLKFGGSSVGSAESIKKVKNIIADYQASDHTMVVVCSAFGGFTDRLIHIGELAAGQNSEYEAKVEALFKDEDAIISDLLAEASPELKTIILSRRENLESLYKGVYLTREFSNRTKDCVTSYGELNSSKVINEYLTREELNSICLDPREIIKTDSTFSAARVDFSKTELSLNENISDSGSIYIIGGFVASNDASETTTLGRGGSDYTASIIAALLDADELQIWTDVNGVMTADPRKVKNAFSLNSITYAEALELSHFGAKVIYPPTIQPVFDKNIRLRIKNTFEPEFPGTLIQKEYEEGSPFIKGITSISDISLLRLEGSGMIGVAGISGRLFTSLARAGISIILISQASSEHSICLAVKASEGSSAKEIINQEFKLEIERGIINEIILENNLSVVAVVGAGMINTKGVSGRMFHALGQNGINVVAIAQGSSELNISVVISKNDEIKALLALHEAAYLSEYTTVNIFILGTGLIGKALLNQMNTQMAYLKEELSLNFRLIGLSNTKKMNVSIEGLDIASYESERDSGTDADLESFVQQMIALNLPHSIFVDNTASEAPIEFYKSILEKSISIVTPNKIANTRSLDEYRALKKISAESGAQFRYETNVGAGLPVISTLQDLMKSGDQIHQIEAVLSGSLSFIFNTFSSEKPFSEVVLLAGEKGYTEPDPRIDLSGKDVARKMLLLAREMGLEVDMEDIKIDPILPEALMNLETIDAFFTALASEDENMKALSIAASSESKVLRFIASISKEEIKVSLQKVGVDSPFYGLSGADNMIVFNTSRYSDRPLVVKGPGAGAEVTAAGVFSEIISISNNYN